MNETENNHVSGENPQGNNPTQPQWPAGYPMPWPGYPAPPQMPAQSDTQNLPPQGQGYFPWIPYPLPWVQPSYGSQPGDTSEPEAQPQAMPSNQEATTPSGATFPGYVPWPYAYPPQMMTWPAPTDQEPPQQDHPHDGTQNPQFGKQPDAEPDFTVEPETEHRVTSVGEEHTPDTQETPAETAKEELPGSEVDAPQEASGETVTEAPETTSDNDAPGFTIVSESEPEISDPSADISTQPEPVDTAEHTDTVQQPVFPANPFIAGVASTPDPAPADADAEFPQAVSRSLNAQLHRHTPEQEAQPLLSDAPTDMPDDQASTAVVPSSTPASENTHYQQPTPEQLEKAAQPKTTAVPPIPPVPPFQPSAPASTSQHEEEPEAPQEHHEPFVMRLPDYLSVDKDIDESSPSSVPDDSAQPVVSHISSLPDAPEPVVGPDGVARIGHAASKLPPALTNLYDEKTGTVLPPENVTSPSASTEPEKTHSGRIVLAIVLVIVLMVLGGLLVRVLSKDKEDSASQVGNLSEAVDTRMVAGTDDVPEGLNISSNHAGWEDNTFTSCYVDSQEDDSTLELVYAARRGDDAFTTLCADNDRQRMLLSMAYRNPESSDSNDFVLLHAWGDMESDDNLGKVNYSNTDSDKNTKSEYRLDQDTLKIYTTSPATASISSSDLVQEVKFDTVWTREE